MTDSNATPDLPPKGITRIWTDVDLQKDGKQLGYFRLNMSTHGLNGVLQIPVAVFKNGPGPRILMLGGVHGDEFEGQVMAMKLMRALDIDNVQGQIIIMSAANAAAAYAGERTSPFDDGDLNRSYPGDPTGTPTQQIAFLIDNVLLSQVDYLLDFHSGGNSTRVIPSTHVYHSPDREKFARLTHMLRAFGMPTSVILKGLNDHDKKAIGSCERKGVLRFASELGGGGGLTLAALRKAETGLRRLLFDLGLLRRPMTQEAAESIELVMRLPNKKYVYAQTAGLFEPYFDLGEDVKEGESAGAIHFPQEPWREPWIPKFADSGKIYAVRSRAHTQMGDVLFMLHVPWAE